MDPRFNVQGVVVSRDWGDAAEGAKATSQDLPDGNLLFDLLLL